MAPAPPRRLSWSFAFDTTLEPTKTMPATSLDITRIDTRRDDARQAIARLRQQLSPQGDVVSPRGRELTIAAFGEPLTPQQVVDKICRDVHSRGLEALLDYTRLLDGKSLDASSLRVTSAELVAAHNQADPDFLDTIRRVADNIRAYQLAILHRDVQIQPGPGVSLGVRYLPLRRVGVCIPGGAAAYPSSLLMTAVPAQVAGVQQIAVVVPPTEFGGYNTDLLAACR